MEIRSGARYDENLSSSFRFREPNEKTLETLQKSDDYSLLHMHQHGYALQNENERLSRALAEANRKLADKCLCEDEVRKAKSIIDGAKRKEDDSHQRWLSQYHSAARSRGIAWCIAIAGTLIILGLGAALAWQHYQQHKPAP